MKRKAEICTMQILVIGATKAEIQPFIDADSGIDVLITGVGVPSTIYHLQKRIQQIQYDLIIQPGIGGSFKPEYDLGQTFIIKQDCFADLGIEEDKNYRPIFESGFADKNEFPFKEGWLINAAEILDDLDLPKTKAITVNKISDSELQKQQYINAFDATVESMEGAALHYVCLQENIPFIQIRSVSNFVGERDKSKWKMQDAISNLNAELIKLINKLTAQP